MSEEKLERELNTYRDLAKQDKKIDVAALMINALQTHQSNLLDAKQKRWAYLISLMVPPVGLYFAVKYYFSGKDDGQEAGLMCVTLTGAAILLLIIFTKALLSGSGANIDQIKTIKPSDIQQLYQ